jgi:BolA protein
MSLIDEISRRLKVLEPTELKITDDSALHAGHQGNGGGGHFTLYITSSHFCKKSLIMRHRLIYQPLTDLMPHKIHALSIHATATDEI